MNKEIVHALKRACPAYEPAPRLGKKELMPWQIELAKWQERMDIADRIGKLIEEYEGKK